MKEIYTAKFAEVFGFTRGTVGLMWDERNKVHTFSIVKLSNAFQFLYIRTKDWLKLVGKQSNFQRYFSKHCLIDSINSYIIKSCLFIALQQYYINSYSPRCYRWQCTLQTVIDNSPHRGWSATSTISCVAGLAKRGSGESRNGDHEHPTQSAVSAAFNYNIPAGFVQFHFGGSISKVEKSGVGMKGFSESDLIRPSINTPAANCTIF